MPSTLVDVERDFPIALRRSKPTPQGPETEGAVGGELPPLVPRARFVDGFAGFARFGVSKYPEIFPQRF